MSHAIHFYMTRGYEVCLPIGDKSDYDIVVEKNGALEKIQVKYGGLYPNKTGCRVALRVMGGNQSYHYAKKYSDSAFDILFVYTAKDELFEIPWAEIKVRSELSVETPKYQKYKKSMSRVTQVANEG